MATAPARTAVPDTPVVGTDPKPDRVIGSKWNAGDFESWQNLARPGDTSVIARVNRARAAVPETAASWLRRYGGDPDVRARRGGTG